MNPTSTLPEVDMVPAYEPPRVEFVLTPEELEREVLYAGGLAPSGGPG